MCITVVYEEFIIVLKLVVVEETYLGEMIEGDWFIVRCSIYEKDEWYLVCGLLRLRGEYSGDWKLDVLREWVEGGVVAKRLNWSEGCDEEYFFDARDWRRSWDNIGVWGVIFLCKRISMESKWIMAMVRSRSP